MNKYELMFIVKADLDEAKIKESAQKIKDLIAAKGGNLVSADEWGRRELAYPISGKNQGYYFVFKFEGPSELNQALTQQFGITEEIIRHMILKVDSFEKIKQKASAEA